MGCHFGQIVHRSRSYRNGNSIEPSQYLSKFLHAPVIRIHVRTKNEALQRSVGIAHKASFHIFASCRVRIFIGNDDCVCAAKVFAEYICGGVPHALFDRNVFGIARQSKCAFQDGFIISRQMFAHFRSAL